MFFPTLIIYKRINTSLEFFYKDLMVFSKNMNWKCDFPKNHCETEESDTKKIHWSNNLVEIKMIETYTEESRPKYFEFEYFIPSPTDYQEIKGKDLNLTYNPPKISLNHKFRVEIPPSYPANLDKIRILSITTIFHPRFSQNKNSIGCIFVNGELDKIAMNLFQHLLWEPSFVFKLTFRNVL
jgi:hypothetical protein